MKNDNAIIEIKLKQTIIKSDVLIPSIGGNGGTGGVEFVGIKIHSDALQFEFNVKSFFNFF
jgi:hypothetical protein